MKIAIDARIIATGTGRYIERLIHHLEKLDHDNDYFILVRRADLDYYKPANPRFTIVEADFKDYSFGEQLGFARLLYRLKPDLVHFCMPQQPLLYWRPCITTVHDLNLLRIASNDDMNPVELRVKKVIFAILLWIVAHKSQHILTPSKFTKNDLLRFSHVKPGKVTVTYEGVDQAGTTAEPVPSLANKQFIMYVGRAEPYKNNRGLISAHQHLLATHPNLRLAIVGRHDKLRQADIAWVEQNKYKNVDFIGFVSDNQLVWLYQHCAAYVLASFMEGFGLPALEAMSAGAPVVSSNATCMPEVYQDGAVYFDPHDTQAMAAAIAAVLGSKRQQAELRAKGAQVAKQYSWQRMAMQTMQTYLQKKQK